METLTLLKVIKYQILRKKIGTPHKKYIKCQTNIQSLAL